MDTNRSTDTCSDRVIWMSNVRECSPVKSVERTKQSLTGICFPWLLINVQRQFSPPSTGPMTLPYTDDCSHQTVHGAKVDSQAVHCLLNDVYVLSTSRARI